MGKWTKYKKKYSNEWEKEEIFKGWIYRVPGYIKSDKTNYLSRLYRDRGAGGQGRELPIAPVLR